MPYPNEHACRLEDPDKYDRFRRINCEQESDGKCIDVIYGITARMAERVQKLFTEIEEIEATALKEDRLLTDEEKSLISEMKTEIRQKSEIQALRYPKDVWDVDAARNHCKERDGSFEAASESESQDPISEHRTMTIEDLRALDMDKESRIEGYAAVFDELSEPLFGFREKIEKGAFKKTVKEDDVRMLFNHDPNYVMGRSKSGTLSLKEDERGLRFVCIPPNAQWVREMVIEPIKRGDISQCSFQFQVLEDAWDDRDSSNIVRTLKKVRLYDVSIVTFPAYTQTDVFVRQAIQAAGVDFDRLSKVMAARTYGLKLTEEDLAFANEARSRLFPQDETREQPVGATPDGKPPEDGATPETEGWRDYRSDDTEKLKTLCRELDEILEYREVLER